MTRIDSVLEQVQKDVEARGRSGAQAVFLTDVRFTIPRDYFESDITCDIEGAICDVSWFFKCAKARMIVPCGNPDTSFFIKFFGKDVRPYGSTWDLSSILDHLRDPDTRRAVLLNYSNPEVPSCVTGYQFQCSDYGVLDCTVTMRSSDVAKVLAQDVFMTKLILNEISKLAGYKSGSLTVNIGNAHVYYEDLQYSEEYTIDYGD
jgi:hypothetical protein